MAQPDAVHLAYCDVLSEQAREQLNPIIKDGVYRTHALQELLHEEIPKLLALVRQLRFPAASYAEQVVAARRAAERPNRRGKGA